MYKITYTQDALKNLTNVFSYICFDLTAPVAATRLMDKIEWSIQNLSQFPFMGKKWYDQINGETYYWLPIENYLVFYVVLDNTVEIRRIIYAKMNLGNVL